MHFQYVDIAYGYYNCNFIMSIELYGNWLGFRWGGFPPWGTVARTDGRAEDSKSDLNAHKLRNGFIYRTFGGSDIALILH